MTGIETPEISTERLAELAGSVTAALERHVLGQPASVATLIASYMAGGHALVEGVPGVGKTRLARGFAACLGLAFTRVQFTPDLMPADVIGTNVYDQASGTFRLVRGPVFTHLLMADEINRTPPKTQAALLEAMQERQVTIDGTSHALTPGFFVVATQNPIEMEGIYPLPEAQLDRFLVRVEMGLPEAGSETEIYRLAVAGELGTFDRVVLPEKAVGPGEAEALRTASRRVHVAPELLDYLAALAGAVRASAHVELAVSPRGALALLETARAGALLAGRDFLVPDDLKRFLGACWAHRLILTAESELEGKSPARILEEVASGVEVPH